MDIISKLLHLGAAISLLTLAWGMGLYMSSAFRLQILIEKDKEAKKKLLESQELKIVSNVQLNNAEWAPCYVICHLYPHSHYSGSLLSAILSMISCWMFVVFNAFLFPGKPAIITAICRCFVLALLIYEVASTG